MNYLSNYTEHDIIWYTNSIAKLVYIMYQLKLKNVLKNCAQKSIQLDLGIQKKKDFFTLKGIE